MQWRLSLGMLVCGALIAGCGGGGKLSVGDYRSKAALVCAEARQKISAIGQPKSPGNPPNYIDRALGATKPEVGKLKALKEPDELKTNVEKALSTLDQEVTTLGSLVTRLKHGAVSGYQSLTTQLTALSKQEDTAWRAAGVNGCGFKSQG